MNARMGRICVTGLAVASIVAALALTGCGAVPTKGSSTNAAGATASTDAPAKPLSLKVGDTATYDGLKVTLVSAGKGPKDYSGKATFKFKVLYENGGTEAASFNEWDWKLEDKDGARANDTAILSGNAKSLGSGDLAPGGKKSGTIYLESPGKVTKVIYEPTFLSSEENLTTWLMK